MDQKYPVGVCKQMCSDEEINHREQNGLLHILETYPLPNNRIDCKLRANRNLVVKEFLRSAAGQHTQNVKHLRTYEALLNTIRYLLQDVIATERVPWHIVYDFIADRLRAIRQDMIIQNLSHNKSITLLQPMVKFYIYASYRLCNEPISKFDNVINNNHLQECLKRLLYLYDEFDQNECNDKILRERPLMESFYILLNLGNTIAMNRAIQILNSNRSKNKLIKTCLTISLAYWKGNFIRVCRLIVHLPHLLAVCAFTHLTHIRKKALLVMSTAYSSKNLTFPIETLRTLLLYTSREEVWNECKYYNIPIDTIGIYFSKDSFDCNKKEPNQKHHKIIDDLLSKQTIPQLLLE